MKENYLKAFFPALLIMAAFFAGCSSTAEAPRHSAMESTPEVVEEVIPPTPEEPDMPDLQAELTDQRFTSTNTPLGTFDFKNFNYPLPRGWQNPDGSDIKLENGILAPIGPDANEQGKHERRIGMSHVVTKFFDMTGDDVDEAIVILKIETGGSAIPQIVYVFEWKDDKPNLIWNFRTGDRSDGGLKDIRPEAGRVTLELFGQDRFLLGEVETGKITGDEEQICCPTHFTRSFYKWNGSSFTREGKRLTFLTEDPSKEPIENMGDIVNKQFRK